MADDEKHVREEAIKAVVRLKVGYIRILQQRASSLNEKQDSDTIVLEIEELQTAKTIFREDLGKAQARLSKIDGFAQNLEAQENPNTWALEAIARQRATTMEEIVRLEKEIDIITIKNHALVMELTRHAIE